MLGVDSVEYAPLDDEQRHGIYRALGFEGANLDAVAHGLIQEYGGLPRTKVVAHRAVRPIKSTSVAVKWP